MATLDDLFEKYLSSKEGIEPSENAVERAKAAHVDLRKDLEKDEKLGSYISKTMLSGSYGRDTAILYIKDVDVIIQTTLTYEDLQKKKHKDETEQKCLLRLTQGAIERTGRTAETEKARRSIHVKLPEEINDDATIPELTMDIVPVLIPNGKDKDPMTIADRELGGWYDTYPASQLEDSKERNSQSSVISGRHNYKPLVKIFKAWKYVHYSTKKTPKGFVLECLTAKYHNPKAKHWVEAVRDLFQNICNEWPNPEILLEIPNVPEISNSSPHQIPIAKKLDDAKKVLQKIHQHLALVKQAIEEAESDLIKSAKTLQRVFGQDCEIICFPLPEDDGDDGNDGGKSKTESSPFVSKSKSDVTEAPAFA